MEGPHEANIGMPRSCTRSVIGDFLHPGRVRTVAALSGSLALCAAHVLSLFSGLALPATPFRFKLSHLSERHPFLATRQVYPL